MALKYAYHPGNIAHSSAPEVADTMPPTARSLGIELTPLGGATSCGAGIIRQANDILQVTLNARTLAMAESKGLDIITPCAATAGNLQEDLGRLRGDPLLLAKTNDVLGRTSDLSLSGAVNVHHLLHVIVDEVGLDKVEARLRNPMRFRIAGYYGPNIQQEGACGDDDVYDPNYFEQLIAALGGTPVEWESRTQSVGVPGLLSEEPTVLRQAAAVISDAKSEGADMIVSACTLSHTVLDVYQGKASRVTGLSTNLPVIHLTELLSFAFGHHNSRLAQLRTRIAVIGD
ncbi:MAG: heterodisulfide reductase-related iron-sulfur binding cluster [Candidatus Thalassarchaeaceae archaeon]|jgi:heterodisulfide reductase subunit B|nr:heterodisulfide reductase-related iron-sulfur binding cluster [Candidatus Thalassarchaeaceae archaeon]MDP7091723.1 heterodisulfide reductase-related iron-sulfur binding cluster [Candidatus Thalassarchaeaceae archaeon]MDP7256944.1 heterodisulfide reductase-related iron-sulfur binding cluster [Candidatus Thalassarchaeaceae archaeon]MDP7446650.1 heterodisulfide reductase-related iron-sulfur binding cluster [Candidatus Thalassarchaeaceae archaeon]MDP7649225.1 heterodisulfide reductase-related ir|tara:strand:- start:1843 stop:2703 length:861 start_codon:yes stop_codon:yes gene_type:complete